MSGLSLRKVLLIIAAFVGCAVCTVGFSTLIAWRNVTHKGEPGNFIHPRVVQTPFTPLRGTPPSSLSNMENFPIYPGSVAKEHGLLGYSSPLLHLGNVSNLSFLRLHSDDPLASVDQWYRDNLGPSFVRSEEPLVALSKEMNTEEPLRFAKAPEESAVLFRQDKGGEVLVCQSKSRGVVIMFILYSHR